MGDSMARWSRKAERPDQGRGRAGSSHTGASTSSSSLPNMTCDLTFGLGKGKFFHLKSSRWKVQGWDT